MAGETNGERVTTKDVYELVDKVHARIGKLDEKLSAHLVDAARRDTRIAVVEQRLASDEETLELRLREIVSAEHAERHGAYVTEHMGSFVHWSPAELDARTEDYIQKSAALARDTDPPGADHTAERTGSETTGLLAFLVNGDPMVVSKRLAIGILVIVWVFVFATSTFADKVSSALPFDKAKTPAVVVTVTPSPTPNP